MKNDQKVIGLEINPKFVGALFTERIASTLRVFCYYTNGDISQFDMLAEENLDNLQHLLSKLKVDENCSSVILDEVVQGRVYVRKEGKYWLYTLLSSPGNVLPPFNTGICNLRWQKCWHSKEVDILEYGKSGSAVHCFAVRTSMNESDAARLVSESKAFASPVSSHKKNPHRRFWLNIGIATACFGLLMAIMLACTISQGAGAPIAGFTAKGNTAETKATSYYLLYAHQIKGPYPVEVIASMSASGLINADAMCRPENSTEWVSLNALFPPQPVK